MKFLSSLIWSEKSCGRGLSPGWRTIGGVVGESGWSEQEETAASNRQDRETDRQSETETERS